MNIVILGFGAMGKQITALMILLKLDVTIWSYYDSLTYVPNLLVEAIENNIYGKKNKTSIVTVL